MSGVKDQKVADITPGDFFRIQSATMPENVPQAKNYADISLENHHSLYSLYIYLQHTTF